MYDTQLPLRNVDLSFEISERELRNAVCFAFAKFGSLIVTRGALLRVARMTDDHQRDILRILATIGRGKALHIRMRNCSDPNCVSQPLQITVRTA